MKAICVNDKIFPKDFTGIFTEGKIYTIISEEFYTYNVMADFGEVRGFKKERFKLLEELRNERIEEILK